MDNCVIGEPGTRNKPKLCEGAGDGVPAELLLACWVPGYGRPQAVGLVVVTTTRMGLPQALHQGSSPSCTGFCIFYLLSRLLLIKVF